MGEVTDAGAFPIRAWLPRGLITAAALLACQVVAASDPGAADDQMRADCRAEGEAGGLDGVDLEAFIRDCIDDLMTVEIGHTDE